MWAVMSVIQYVLKMWMCGRKWWCWRREAIDTFAHKQPWQRKMLETVAMVYGWCSWRLCQSCELTSNAIKLVYSSRRRAFKLWLRCSGKKLNSSDCPIPNGHYGASWVPGTNSGECHKRESSSWREAAVLSSVTAASKSCEAWLKTANY